jgi:hypothetical protein
MILEALLAYAVPLMLSSMFVSFFFNTITVSIVLAGSKRISSFVSTGPTSKPCKGSVESKDKLPALTRLTPREHCDYLDICCGEGHSLG